MKKSWENWLVLALLVLGLSLHLIKLDQNPTFISDEASIGYNAYSVLKTGRDEWGQFLPLTFKAFGEHKLPLYIYASVLPIGIFGLNELGTRFISAFFGALSGLFIYLIARKLPLKKGNFSFALVVLFLFTINPWHLQTSRMALEANLALFFFLVGFWFFLEKSFVRAAIFLALTFYTYNTFRVFGLLFILLTFLFKKWNTKKLLPSILVFLVLISPLIFSGFKGSGERVFKVSIFADSGIVSRIEQKRVSCQKYLSFNFCRLVYNRPVVYTSEIFKNYFSHFDPRFLFSRGAGLAQYTMPDFGAVYWLEVFLLPFGFWQFLRSKSLKEKFLPWLLAAPVATSFTGLAHPVRSLVLMPLLAFFSGLGIIFWRSRLSGRKKAISFLVLILGFFSLAYFGYRYFLVYPTQAGSIWQGGYKPLFKYLDKNEGRFEQIKIAKFYGEPHIFYLFYHRFDPAKYQKDSKIVKYDRQDRWVNVDRIGKYYFFEEADFEAPGLVVLGARQSQPEIEVEKEILFPKNKETAFKIYEIKN